MASIDLGKRIVQMIWDPEPINDASIDLPAWCLGREYTLRQDSSSRGGGIGASCKAPAAPPDRGHPTPSEQGPSSSGARDPTAQDAAGAAAAPAAAAAAPPNPPAPPAGLPQDAAKPDLASPSGPVDGPLNEGGWPAAFLDDFGSRIWMTYRSDFDPIPRSPDPKAYSALSLSMKIKSQLVDHAGFTSDSGWGCMIRSGQSLLANAMIIQELGRGWRRGDAPLEERRILSLFADHPAAPYSIHSFVHHGAEACGTYPGQWFGPSATARCINALVDRHGSCLRVYSTGDSPEVDTAAFLAVAKPDGQPFGPTLILVGTRLGTDKITPTYWDGLIGCLRMTQSVGIAGGRPSSSHYFIGTQQSYLFYLDPHHTRRALPHHPDPAEYTDADVDSCHTSRLRRLHIKEMDPSMLIGFLIRDEQDWIEWLGALANMEGPSVITVVRPCPPDQAGEFTERASAIDEVQSLSDEDTDTVVV